MNKLQVTICVSLFSVPASVAAAEYCYVGSKGLVCIDLGAGGGGGCGGNAECGGNNDLSWIPPYLDTHKDLIKTPENYSQIFERFQLENAPQQ